MPRGSSRGHNAVIVLLASHLAVGILTNVLLGSPPAVAQTAAPDTARTATADSSFVPVYLPELRVQRTTEAIDIDGVLDDPGWRVAGRAGNFAEHNPGDQTKPPVDTEAWLTYDDDYLYVAWICNDDPAALRASFTERDRMFNDDFVMLLLDTFGEQTWAYEIACNPYGIQGDLLYSATGGEDSSYDLVYYSSARITERGWQAEMAIPWSSLRFPNKDEQVWRVDFWRNHPREARRQYSWAAYDRDEPCWPCKWGTVVGVEGVRPGAGLEVLPAVTATQGNSRTEEGNFEPFDTKQIQGEPSLGVKYNVTSSVTAEATINPDFSQVESDAAQIDVNTTFALFFPERRPFFQEGSDLFNTWFDIVYTRTINDPIFAAKAIGRPGADNLAVLTAQDRNSPFILPFEEKSQFVAGRESVSTLARYQHSMGEGSHLGFIGTDRRHAGGGSGSVVGFDTRIRLTRNWQVELQGVATYTQEPNDTTLTEGFNDETFARGKYTSGFDGESYWGHGAYFSLERNARHWNFDVDYRERAATFRVENGFEPRNDQRIVNAWSGYMIYGDGLVERFEPQFRAARVWNMANVQKDEWAAASVWSRLAVAQTSIWAQYIVSNELFNDIQFDDIWSFDGEINMQPSSQVSLGVWGGYGDRIARDDLVLGRETSLGAWLDLKPVDRFIVESSFRYIRSDALDDGRRLFLGYIARSRLNLQLTRELSMRVILQYNDFSRTWEADPLITFRLNPFSIFYVGSTRRYEELVAADNEARIEGWKLTDRTYFMKLQWLFQL